MREFLGINWELCRDAKEGMNQSDLPDHIALRQPPDLAFPDQVHRLVSFDRSHSPFRRPKPQARSNALLNEPMVLFNDVV
jgi:hypothetical protein